jgi:exopolyphosphatase/guanosine-5'-triphosphate,3'-diphosphate pyrophosphatase
VAALDCGTNSTRLLVAGTDGSTLVRLMRITRLGQGVDATGRLAPEAVERTLDVLGDYRATMDDLGVGRRRLVATSAVRDAANGQEFLSAAGAVAGTVAELLSGEEEGRLSYAGATAGLAPAPGGDLVVDIGGGSTELVVGGPPVGGAGTQEVSLDIGCVRLSERHFHHDPPTPEELDAAVATVQAALAQAEATVPALGAVGPATRLIGLAGTVSTLAMLELGLDRYDRDRVHHALLSAAAVGRWCDRLAALTATERRALPGMVEGREDVIVGGVVVLREVMARWAMAECLVSESDILDGLVASLLGA